MKALLLQFHADVPDRGSGEVSRALATYIQIELVGGCDLNKDLLWSKGRCMPDLSDFRAFRSCNFLRGLFLKAYFYGVMFEMTSHIGAEHFVS